MANGSPVPDSAIWDVIKWLGSIVVTLLGIIGIREHGRVSALYAWRDKVVDPALRTNPEKFISRDQCDRCHDDLKDMLQNTLQEVQHIRNTLEKHVIKIDGQ